MNTFSFADASEKIRERFSECELGKKISDAKGEYNVNSSVAKFDDEDIDIVKLFDIDDKFTRKLSELEAVIANFNLENNVSINDLLQNFRITCDGKLIPPKNFVKENEIYFDEKYTRFFCDENELKKFTDNSSNSDLRIRCPENHGHWEETRGDSMWHPDPEYIPPEKSKNPDKPYSNPDNLCWNEILKKYELIGVEFKDGFPVFEDISKGTVEIQDFRTGGTEAKVANFNLADKALAEMKGCTPREVRTWRKENNFTWHECEDKKTMQKIPNEVHANIPHDGGRSQ